MQALLLLIVTHGIAGVGESRPNFGNPNVSAMPLPRSTREVALPAGATVMDLWPIPAIDTLYLDSVPILDIGRVDPNRITRAELRGAEFGAAFMSDGSLVVLDGFEVKIFERFRELTEDKIAIVISHRFSTVRMADQIIVLDRGSIIERGSHDELVAKGGRYATLFNLQAQGYR